MAHHQTLFFQSELLLPESFAGHGSARQCRLPEPSCRSDMATGQRDLARRRVRLCAEPGAALCRTRRRSVPNPVPLYAEPSAAITILANWSMDGIFRFLVYASATMRGATPVSWT